MKYTTQFDQIRTILKKYEGIWRFEILETYPNHLTHYPSHWISELSEMTDEQLFDVDINTSSKHIKNDDFKNYLDQIIKFSELPRYHYPELKKFPAWAFFKVKEKKEHEIKVLAHKLRELKNNLGFNELIDIGGGVGHLARFMAHYQGIKTTSIDINKDFQEIGKRRLKKFPTPDNASEVNFINYDFSNLEQFQKENNEVFNSQSFSLGLHTCGALANSHLEVHLKNKTKGIINFGCCYNRLCPNRDVNLSTFAKSSPINYSAFSLTLAARGHDSMNFEEFQFKRRVKNYRYMFHILLKDHLKQDIYAIGDSHPRYYKLSFGEFATWKLEKIGLSHNYDQNFLEKLYQDNLEVLNKMFFANIIRWQLGRLLELSIIYDRAIYLQENNQQVEIARYFDKKLSPRNIGILSITDES